MSNLSDLYYNPTIGLISIDKFYKRLKDLGHNFKRREVEDFVKNQFAYQVNKQVKKPKEFNTIYAPFNRYGYQMDIMVYDRYEYQGYKYILCVIDVHSRYAQCKALTNMNMTTIMNKFKEIVDKMGIPNNINCDNQFNNKAFLDYCKANDIVPHFSDPEELNKNAIIERFHRTLARLIQRWREATRKYDWYKVLPELVENYNTAYHKTIKAIPAEVWNNKATNKQIVNRVETKLKVGDIVRIKKVKGVLEKGDYITYSRKTYDIVAKDRGKFVLKETNTQEQLSKHFKAYELQKANVIQYKPDTEELEPVRPTRQRKGRELRKVRVDEQGFGYLSD
jgi:ribosomal protein L30E